MAGYHIEGLGNWKRSSFIWGSIGILTGLTSLPAILPWILPATALGSIAGWAAIQLLSKDRAGLADIPGYVCIVVLIACLMLLGSKPGVFGFLSLGCLYTASNSLASGILGGRLVKDLNHRHRDKLATIARVLQPAPPPEPITQQLVDELISVAPEHLRHDLNTAFQPVIVATPFRTLESLPPSSSSLSGAPMLAAGEAWPSRAGEPMEFLARINLAELPASSAARPSVGVLSFFYDVENQPWGGEDSDQDGFAVVYHGDPSSLQTVLKPGTGPHPPLRKPLRFEQVPAFSPSRELEEQVFEITRNAEDDASCRLDELYETALESNPSEGHRVLSRPALIQNDMDPELVMAARLYGLPEATGWTLLLQLDSDSDLGWMWGDSGSLYFWVPSADLAEARFDRSWVVLQCC